MKISKTKGQHPRFPVLKQAHVFDAVMGPILTHLKANNTMEIVSLRRSANFLNNVVFHHVMTKIPITVAPAPLETLLRYNDTVSWLRTRHTKTSKRIGKSQFGCWR